MNITMTLEDFEKLRNDHFMEVFWLKEEVRKLKEDVERNGMDEEYVNGYSEYLEEQERLEKLENDKCLYFTGNGTNDI